MYCMLLLHVNKKTKDPPIDDTLRLMLQGELLRKGNNLGVHHTQDNCITGLFWERGSIDEGEVSHRESVVV